MGSTSTITVHHSASDDKGTQKRTVREELSLRVRILNGRHVLDALQRVEDELGPERAQGLGPIDLARNPLLAYVNRTARAYLIPPLVDDLPEELATLIGDSTARTVVSKYGAADGARPMPTQMRSVCNETLRWRIGCNFGGTLLGYSEDTGRPYFKDITPDDLEVEYRSDDPRAPTVIRHYGMRSIDGDVVETTDLYDLTDLDVPVYRVHMGHAHGYDPEYGDDVTEKALGSDGWATIQAGGGWWPWWRYDDFNGRPWHRIVIEGDPRQPYRNIEIAEGTLGAVAIYTHARAGVRDAGFPRTHAIDLHLEGQSSDATKRASGQPAGPEYAVMWRHRDPEKPGELIQLGPGFDPESTMKAARIWELGLIDPIGLPVDFESTGGDPQALAAEALKEAITMTFDEARAHDGLCFKRCAAMTNRATAWLDGVEATAFPEVALSVLYREEITDALGAIPAPEPVIQEDEAEEE